MSRADGRSDEELVGAARNGDRQALEALLLRHQAQVYRFGLKLCRDPEDARDVLQDTLLAMARGVGDFRGASSVSTWLYAIARSACIKKRRRRKDAPREVRSLDGDRSGEATRVADPTPAPDALLGERESALALERAIDALDPKYREVLLLRDVEGLPAREVAEVLGLGVQAVKSRLHRARLAVREALEPRPEGLADLPAAPDGCPDVLMLLSRHLEDEIAPAACAEMERHLEGCRRCRSACDSLRRVLALCRATPAQVPASVQGSVREAIRRVLHADG
jgi:RNA polymerase sigma-70 factor (ECF subfamily)